MVGLNKGHDLIVYYLTETFNGPPKCHIITRNAL